MLVCVGSVVGSVVSVVVGFTALAYDIPGLGSGSWIGLDCEGLGIGGGICWGV